MSNQHAGRAVTIRPPADVIGDTRRILSEHELELLAFFVACMVELRSDPDRVLARLRAHWPEPKTRGRPAP